jgi:hypothetical protein
MAFTFEWDATKAALSMKKPSTKTDDLVIPELTRAQLGRGVRGRFFKKFMHGSNVVVLRPELLKAFPSSEAVNDALTSYLAFVTEARGITVGTAARVTKRKAA